MVFFNKGERVWASSKDIGWALGTVVTQEGQTVIVKLDSNGDEQKFPEGKLIQFVPESLQDFEDMVKINDLNEPVLLNNLKQRYAADKIYTLIGPVLVSMNPYKSLPIYSRQVMKDYSTTRPGDPKNTRSPHIFSIANNAYRSLLSNRLNQSVVISGESGAGKTEATKFVLQYLAYVSDPLSTGKVEQQILESSPILEAFGNAKTIRNNNSSRFGKFTKITFDQRGHISGAEITNYLLEKSRIPYHAPNERNYHVFYQFCRGASAEERRALDLQPAESYVYLNQGKAVSINGVDDAADYRRLRNAMTILGLSQTEQLDIFRVLSCILHLGNITFEQKTGTQKEEWRVKDRQLLGTTAKLLGTDPDHLETALVKRSFQASASRKSTYAILLNQKQAEESRDALSKTLYGIMFDWLVDRVNQPLKPPNTEDLFIGVLDIFGFEIFEKNSFEQVLINLTNEKILQLFNQHMFKSEQAEYQAEGINWSQVAFKDNQEVIDMVEKRPVGILHLLDEECVMPNGNEKALLDKMSTAHQNNKFFYKKRTHPTVFGIKHYAGEVDYEVTGMMDKNRDTLFPDLEGLMKDSQCGFIAALFNKTTGALAAAAATPATATPTTTAPSGPMSSGAKWAANQSAGSSPAAAGSTTLQRKGAFGAPAGDVSAAINGMAGAATIKRLGPPGAPTGAGAGAAVSPTLKREAKTGGRATVSAQFREQLAHLSSILSNTNVHYIWCIKPNTAQKPNSLDDLYLLNQMRCTGIMETIKIRKQGFAARRPFEEFVHRYRILFARGTVFTKQNAKMLSTQFLQYYAAETPDQWQVGKSKVFLRERQLYLLDVQREEQLAAVANTIARFMRTYVARRKFLRMKAERERKRREEEERRRREEEERRRREEEERKRREEVERLRREEEERRRREEELRRRQEEEERRRRAEEERRYREEEERRKRDEEERRRQEEERRRLEEEQRRQAVVTARARQEEDQRRRQEEEERRRQAAADEEAAALRQRQREEERRRILAAQAALPPPPSMTYVPPPVAAPTPAPLPAPMAEVLNPAELARRQREAELAKKREELEKRRADLQRRKEEEERKRRELETRIEDHQPPVRASPGAARPMSNFVPGTETPPSAQTPGPAQTHVGGSYIVQRTPSNYEAPAAKPAPLRKDSGYAQPAYAAADTPGGGTSPGNANGSRLAGRQMGAPPAPPEEAPFSVANLPPPPQMFAPPPPVFFPTEAPPAPPETAVPDTPPPMVSNGYRNFYTSMPTVPVVGSGMVDLKIGAGAAKQASGAALSTSPNTPSRIPIEEYPSMSPGRSNPLDSRIVSSPADKLLAGVSTPKAGSSYQSASPLSQSGEYGRGRTDTATRANLQMSAMDFLSAVSAPAEAGPLSPTSAGKRDAATTMQTSTVKRNEPAKNGMAPNPYEESTELWFRFNIINEVLSTEREYVRDIMLLIEIYLQPLRASNLVTASEIQSLFSNVELLVNLNKQLLGELEKSQYPYENCMIGQIFLKLSEYFKMYKVYCANHPTSIQVYESVAKSNPKFVKFVEQASQDVRCRGLMLSSFLIKPVQRVLKYPLLLRELRKYTKPDHPDSANLVAAQAKIDELAAALNESQRLAEGLQKIVDLQNSIEDCGELVTPTRRLLKDMAFVVRPDTVNEKPSDRHVFLFNDLILIAAKYKSFAKKAIQWQSRAQILIADCKLIFIAEDTLNNTFGLESTVGRKTYTYILTAPDPQSKKEWFETLKELKKQAQIKAIAPKKIIIPESFAASPTTGKKR